ncbi:hypothetical protein OH76DRAFT_816353 [Lentinus brumalis]|uniref:Uncharacterized protein n=1 Tax=Lentinus brumalis TaxID=2498619 RepID=A0A371D2H1_9APHY|nr:hypothetical protein OH76DRAFT_816353 [Polyporus brumalis]
MVESRCRHCFRFPLRFTGRLLLPLLLTTALASCASASSVNRTIDDETGDSVTGVVPTYSPPAAWKQGSTCSGCFIQLDPDHVLGGTWHDATHGTGDVEPLLITAQFSGTAVYVYNVLANTVPWTTTYTSLTFSLDGEQVGTYVHVPTSDTAFEYDVPVYTNGDLANKQHTLIIEATGSTNNSLVLFDYIVYTFTEEDAPPPSSSSTTTTVASPTTTSSSTGPVTSPGTTTSSSSSLSLSISSLSPSGTSSTLSGNPSLNKLQTATSGNTSTPSSTSTSSSSSADPSPTIAAANVSQHSSSFPVGAVAGGVAGGVIVIAVLVFLLWLLRKRRAQQTAQSTSFSADGHDSQMRATGDMLVSSAGASGPGGSSAGGGSVFHNDSVGGTPSVSASSTSRLSQPAASAAYLAHAEARYASSPSYHTHSESTGAPSDYSSRPSMSDTAGLSQQSDSSRAGLRPLPVPSSPRSASSPTSPATTDPFVDPPSHARTDSSSGSSSRPSTRALPPVAFSEKSPLGPPATRSLPVPPVPGADVPASPTNTTSTSILRTQVAVLQEEVARLREQTEMQMFMDEAPPRYDEARV